MVQVHVPVEDVLRFYREAGNIVEGPAEEEARADFRRFYAAVIARGLRGIRWNFSGCVVCARPRKPAVCRRILMTNRQILKATDGRGFGGLICVKHNRKWNGLPQYEARVILPAVLRSLKEHPTDLGPA